MTVDVEVQVNPEDLESVVSVYFSGSGEEVFLDENGKFTAVGVPQGYIWIIYNYDPWIYDIYDWSWTTE